MDDTEATADRKAGSVETRRGAPVNWINLQEDYERLGTCRSVAEMYGCNPETVRRALKRHGIQAHGLNRAKDEYIWNDKGTLQEAYDRLGSIRAVAELYGCGFNTIQRATKRLGLRLPVTNTGRKYVWTDERRANHKAATNTPKFKEAHRVSLLSRFDLLRGSSTNSPLEALLHAALNRAGVSYTTQQVKLGRYSVDIELLQAPVIIEADGFNHRLDRQQAKDRVRDLNLTGAGYLVFRFTGTEINADADGCIRKVMKTAGVTPDTHPIADIRRQGVGPDNMNWRGGKSQFICDYCHKPFMAYASCRQSKHTFCDRECWFAYRKTQVKV